MLIDIHCHLEWESYQDDFDAILERAKNAGVGKIITIGINEASNLASRVLVTKYDQVYRTVGYHPDCVIKEGFSEDDINRLMKLLEQEVEYPKTVGIGECGLDYYVIDRDEALSSERKIELRALQQELFERQILLSIQCELPLSLHVRDTGEEAYDDVVSLLREYFGPDADYTSREFSFSLQHLSSTYDGDTVLPDTTEFVSSSSDRALHGVLHCVSGSEAYVDACRSMGFLVSFAGNVTYKNADVLLEHARRVPLEEILVETDGPFLSPVPYRGKRNEPAYVVETAKKIAEIKGVSFDDVCNVTTENTKRLFGI